MGLLVTLVSLGALADTGTVAKNTGLAGANAGKLWIENTQGSTGELVIVKVMMENSGNDVDAVTLDVAFDPAMLSFVKHSLGELNPQWQMESAREVSPGVARFVAFAVNSNIPKGSSGSLVELVFKVTCDLCKSNAAGTIKINNIHDDIDNYNLAQGTFTFLGK